MSATSEGNLSLALVGIGWEENRNSQQDEFDLDASVLLLGKDGKLQQDEDFIFYNFPVSRNRAVILEVDNRTGAGKRDVDKEQLTIDFSKMPDDVEKLVVVASIHEGLNRSQNFGQIFSAYIRVAEKKNESDKVGENIRKFDLKNEFSKETAIVMVEGYRDGDSWDFKSVAKGYQGGLVEVLKTYGADV